MKMPSVPHMTNLSFGGRSVLMFNGFPAENNYCEKLSVASACMTIAASV